MPRRSLKLKIILVVIILSAAIFIGIMVYFAKQRDRRFLPTPNPKPVQFLSLYGKLDPTLSAYVWVNYATQKPECEKTANFLEGAMRPRYWSKKYLLHLSKKGKFKMKIPTDLLFSGRCNWQAMSLSYQVAIKGQSELSYKNALIVYQKPATHMFTAKKNIYIICQKSATMNHGLYCMPHTPPLILSLPLNTKQLAVSFNVQATQGSIT